MYYFLVTFKDNKDIYIVRVRTNKQYEVGAKKQAKQKVISRLYGVTEKDFEIKRLTLEELLSKFHFVEDIAELDAITHP